MFSIKACFKKKNILLGKNLHSLQDIEKQLQLRFPGQIHQKVIFKFGDQQIQSYSQIEQIVEENKLVSIKLHVLPLHSQSASKLQPDDDFSLFTQEVKIDLEGGTGFGEDSLCFSFPFKTEEIKIQSYDAHGLQNTNSQPKMQQGNCKQSQNGSKVQENSKTIVPYQQEQETAQAKQDGPQQKSQQATELKAVTIQKFWRGFSTRMKLKQIEKAPCQLVETKTEQAKQTKSGSVLQKQQSALMPPETQNGRIEQSQQTDSGKQLDNESHPCFFCRAGKGCQVCDGQGRLSEHSSVIKLISEIVDSKVQAALKGYKLVPIQAVQKQEEQPISLIGLVENYQRKHQQETADKRAELQQIRKGYSDIDMINLMEIAIEQYQHHQQFNGVGGKQSWQFIIRAAESIPYHFQVKVVDLETMSEKPIQFGPNRMFTVGPYDTVGKTIEKTFRLAYSTYGSKNTFFGPKFGFRVNRAQTTQRKALRSQFREKLVMLRAQYKVEKNIEYIIETLKKMQITELNYKEAEGIILDVMRML